MFICLPLFSKSSRGFLRFHSFFVSVVFLFLLFALIVSFFANLIEGFLRVHSFVVSALLLFLLFLNFLEVFCNVILFCFCPIVVPIFSFFEAFLFVPSFFYFCVSVKMC